MLPFDLSEYKARIEKTRQKMRQSGIDVALITRPENIYYLSGYRSVGHGIAPLHTLILPLDREPTIVARMLESETVKAYSWIRENHFYNDFEDVFAQVRDIISEMKSQRKTIGLEMATHYMSVGTYERLKKVLPDAVFKDFSGQVESLRMIKSPKEIEYSRQAARLTDLGLMKGIEVCAPGLHEYEVVAEILETLYRHGQDDLLANYFTVNSGPAGGHAHDTYRDRVIEKQDVVFIELNGTKHAYTINGIVTLYMGNAPKPLRDAHKVTKRLYQECVTAAKPGAKAEDVWKVADRIYKEEGLGPYYRRVGFTVGLGAMPVLSVSEGLDLLKGEKRELKPGMILSIEPGAGSFGIATGKRGGVGTLVGSDILVTKNGNEPLNTPLIELYEKQ